MNVTLSLDEKVVAKARERLRAVGKSLNQEIRDHLQQLVGDDDLERELEEFVRLSGQGNSQGWTWNREDAYADRLRWPRKQ
jgi:hypothetical protein